MFKKKKNQDEFVSLEEVFNETPSENKIEPSEIDGLEIVGSETEISAPSSSASDNEFEVIDLNDESNPDNQKKFKKEKQKKEKKKKSKSKNNGSAFTDSELSALMDIPTIDGKSFINIGESGADDAGDFIVISNNTSILGKILKVLNGIALGILILAATVLVYLGFSYKLIPADVSGSEFNIGNYSIVSRYYQPNIEELQIGDWIVVGGEGYKSWQPIPYDMNTYKVTGRKGFMIFCENDIGKQETVFSTQILYIIKDGSIE